MCSFLDVTRQTLGESTRDMERLVARYAEEYGLNELHLVYTDRRGYHLTLPASQRKVRRPSESACSQSASHDGVMDRQVVEANGFIRIASNAKKTVACSTEQLAQLNLRCKDMIAQILMSTEAEVNKLQVSATTSS